MTSEEAVAKLQHCLGGYPTAPRSVAMVPIEVRNAMFALVKLAQAEVMRKDALTRLLPPEVGWARAGDLFRAANVMVDEALAELVKSLC